MQRGADTGSTSSSGTREAELVQLPAGTLSRRLSSWPASERLQQRCCPGRGLNREHRQPRAGMCSSHLTFLLPWLPLSILRSRTTFGSCVMIHEPGQSIPIWGTEGQTLAHHVSLQKQRRDYKEQLLATEPHRRSRNSQSSFAFQLCRLGVSSSLADTGFLIHSLTSSPTPCYGVRRQKTPGCDEERFCHVGPDTSQHHPHASSPQYLGTKA